VAAPVSSAHALRWRWLAPILGVLALVHFTPLHDIGDRAFFDFSARHPARPLPPPDGSALVLVDDATLDALRAADHIASWPPPRWTFAALIAGLERAGARKIVLDFIFLDRSSDALQDEFLGSLAAGLPEVTLARTSTHGPVFWDTPFVESHPELFEKPRAGLAEGAPDPDGVLRRYAVPLSLAATAFPTTPPPRGSLLRWHGGVEKLRTSSTVPVLSAGRFILAGLDVVTAVSESTPEFTPASLVEALRSRPPLTGAGFDDVRDRVVFVGASAAGTFDHKPFALGGLEPGVLYHWTAWANLAGAGFLRELPRALPLALAALFLAFVTWLGTRVHSIALPSLVAAALILGTLGAAYAALSAGWFLPPTTPVVASGLALLGVAIDRFWFEQRRRREVQAIFGSYVAPEVVDLLVHNPSAIELGGERREATVFFCDLAGFTDLSEQVTPEQLLDIVNGYLQETSDCLLAHGAYIDKYIGDAVMAVFGVPIHQPDHALAACRGALATQRLLAARNEHLARTYGRTLGLRIGLNTGEMIVGNMGSHRKKNYTVLGDCVNLASRLEGANKEFGTGILLGENTARLVRDSLILRPLTGLRVKGKNTAVSVYELVGEPGSLPPDRARFFEAYTRAHALYTSRRFSEAAHAFTAAAALGPDDRMTALLLDESRRFAQHPPPPDWQPVLSLSTK
jgi:Adenylate cyclase, family 3 (some proteins contain HAMP domain)